MTTEEKRLLAQQMTAIARRAGAFIAGSKIGEVVEKGGAANVVTDIDVRCQQLIISDCLKCLPGSGVLAEEESCQRPGGQFTWVIDPIDGTTNYIYDYRHSCVSIALYEQGRGLAGVVYDPYLDECFVGIEGVGSTCNGRDIHVSGNGLQEALVMVGTAPYNKESADETFAVMKRLFLNARDIRRSGSAALDLCYLACGRVDAFYEYMLQPWDYGAGSIIVRGAGGVAEAVTEDAVERLRPTGMICSNGVCHREVRDIVLERAQAQVQPPACR